MQTKRRRICSRVDRGELSRQLPTPTAIYARREALMAEIRSKLAEGDKMAARWQDTIWRYVNTIEWLPWIHVWTCCRLWTNKCRMPRGSRWVLSRRVALSYFLFASACRKSTNPFECSIFRRGSPTTAALSPARAAGSASKAVPFLFFYCFQIFGMWCLHHLARSWCSNWIFVVFVWILCSSYSVAQQATYTVQACAGLSGRIKAVDFHCTLSQFLPAAGSRSRLFSA